MKNCRVPNFWQYKLPKHKEKSLTLEEATHLFPKAAKKSIAQEKSAKATFLV